MAMTAEERARFEWLMNEVARLRKLVEDRQTVTATDAPAIARPVGRVTREPAPWTQLPARQREVRMECRTVAEVMEAKRHGVTGGCCNQFADNKGCDCLELARRYEASLADRSDRELDNWMNDNYR